MLLLIGCVCLGALTYDQDYYQKERKSIGAGLGTSDPLYLFIGEVEEAIGDLDPDSFAPTAIEDLESIAFAAKACTVTLTADGAADDLTIAVAGATNSSLILSSAGTAADAMQLTTTAGGIDITATGAAGEDIDITAATSSVNITAGEAVADAVKITTAAGGGGIQIACGGNLAVTVTGAGTYQGTWLPAGAKKKTITTGTLTTADCGYVLQVEQDAQTITLPATASGGPFWIMNTAADGESLLTIDLDGSDKFIGAGLAPADGESILLTKATGKKGDFIRLVPCTEGYFISEMAGVWAEESP
jgi:hypothetical protein